MMGSPLLQLIPKDRRPAAIGRAALELACAASVGFKGTVELSKEEYQDMLVSMLEDARAEGMIKGWKQTLDRFEVIT